LRWAGLITKKIDMKTELNKNEKLSTEQETPPIANVLLGVGFYRCGYCGQPTDKDGEPLDLEACKTWQEDKAELVHGNCCVHEQNQRQTIIVTRDMAIDAGDMSLEGQEWVW
jgi:hypothetical protein